MMIQRVMIIGVQELVAGLLGQAKPNRTKQIDKRHIISLLRLEQLQSVAFAGKQVITAAKILFIMINSNWFLGHTKRNCPHK